MIAALAAWALAGAPVAGCGGAGPMVRCVLAAPIHVPQKPAPVRTAAVDIPPRAPAAAARPKPPRKRAHGQPDRESPPSEAEIGAHIDSLTSIGDCTGARAYAQSVGETDLAARAFATCVGGPVVPRETAAR